MEISHRPLRGRGEELERACAVLHGWLTSAPEPTAQQAQLPVCNGPALRLLTVSGPAAIGKSRFCQEVLKRMQEGLRPLMLSLECKETTNWAEFIDASITINTQGQRADPARHWRKLCSDCAEHLSSEQLRHFEILTAAYAHFCASIEQQSQAPRSLDRSTCTKLLAALLSMRSLIEGRALLLWIDDFQWLAPVQEPLESLLEILSEKVRLVVLATRRSDEVEPVLRCAPVERQELKLTAIRPEDGLQIMQDVMRQSEVAALDPDIHISAAGLPLYYEQLGLYSEDAAGRKLTSEMLTKLGLEGLIAERLINLSQDEMQMVRLLAVAGRGLRDHWITGLYRRLWPLASSMGADTDTVESDQLRLNTHRLLVQVSDLQLEHDKVREVILRTMPEQERMALHGAVADELRRQRIYGDDSETDILTAMIRHLDAAGRIREAHIASCDLLIMMLETPNSTRWPELAEYAEKTAGDSSVYLRRVKAYEILRNGDRKGARDELEAALAEIGDTADFEIMEIKGKLLGDLAGLSMRVHDHDQAIRLFEDSLKCLRQAGNYSTTGITLTNIGIAYHRKGKLIEALHRYEEAERLAVQHSNDQALAAVYGNLGTVFLDMGNYERSRFCFQKSIELCDKLNMTSSRAQIEADYANLLRETGDLELAEEHYEEASTLVSLMFGDLTNPVLEFNKAKLKKKRVDYAKAETLLIRAMELLAEEDAGVRGIFLSEQADVLMLAGNAEGALTLLLQAADLFEGAALEIFYGVHLCYLAIVHCLLGHRVEAKATLAQAEELYRKLGEPRDLDFWPELQRARSILRENGGLV